MKNSKHSLLVLDYLPLFECSASCCGDTCCSGWTVFFDRQTLEQHEKVDDPELGPLLRSAVEKGPADAPAPSAAKLKLDPETGRCPLLSSTGLCRVHEKLGEQYLSYTCARYPRQDSVVDDQRERSLTLSCPEAAQLVLKHRAPLVTKLIEVPDESRDYLCQRSLDTRRLPAEFRFKSHFQRIRKLVIAALQQRSMPFNDRLLMVGVLCQKLDELVRQRSYGEIGEYLEAFEQQLQSTELKAELSRIPPRTEVQLLLLRAITTRQFEKGISHTGLAACAREFWQGLKLGQVKDDSGYLDSYRNALRQFYMPFMQDHEFMLENWCVNDVFRTLFPFDSRGSIFDQYATLALKVALAKFYLTGVGAYKGGLSEDLVVRVVQCFSRGFEASVTFHENLLGLLESQNLKNLTTVAMLIKD